MCHPAVRASPNPSMRDSTPTVQANAERTLAESSAPCATSVSTHGRTQLTASEAAAWSPAPPAPDSMAAGNRRFSAAARTAGGIAAFGLTEWWRSTACHAAAAAHTSPAAAAATSAPAVAAQAARAAVAAVEAAPAAAAPRAGWPAEGVPAARPRAAGERDAADAATPTTAGVESFMATAPKAMATAATLAHRSADEIAVAALLVAARRVSQSPRALAAAATK